jgi:uncharacterized small protein (DUF1192 family)
MISPRNAVAMTRTGSSSGFNRSQSLVSRTQSLFKPLEPPSSVVEYERLFLEAHKQQGQIGGLEEELARVKADLSVEKRSRAKAVSVYSVLDV